MSDSSSKYQELREKAKRFLASGEYEGNQSFESFRNDVGHLIEELEIYDVELTLQNKQLRHSENELATALRRFESLFDCLPLASLVADKTGMIIQANDYASQLFGFRNKEMLENHSLLRLVSAHDRDIVFKRLNGSKEETVQIGPVTIGHGTSNLADFYFTSLPDSYHLDKRILITIVERTKHYLRLRKLLLLQTLVDAADSRIFAFDMANHCIFANAKEAERIGLSRSELIGKRRDAWMKEEDVLKCERQDALVYTTDQNYLYEEKISQKGKADQYYMTHKFPLTDEHGETFGVGSISTEVTQNREQRERLNLAMSAYTMGKEAIVITDSNNKIIMINQAFTKITGFKEDEVRGKDPKLLSSGRQKQSFYKAMWADIRSKGYWEGELWNRKKSGEVYPEWLTISKVLTPDGGAANYIGVFSDITKKKMAEDEIRNLAFFDTLTGLPNRYLLLDRVQQLINEYERDDEQGFALLFFDLDEFKQINDVHGHAAGDEVLKIVAKRVSELIREVDTLCRLGGDEFVLILKDIDIKNIRSRVNGILGSIREVIDYKGQVLQTSASFGVALFPDDGLDLDSLMRNADTAMYEAKAKGRHRVEFFNTDMADKARQQLNMEYALQQALGRNELSLVYQPIVDIRSSKILGAEALLRWDSKHYGSISPAVFIPIAENIGAIDKIGAWVVRESVQVLKNLNQQTPDFSMAINISPKQLESDGFVELLEKIVDEAEVDSTNIELEITETMIMARPEWAITVLKKLKQRGFKLSLDDFGTGYSSMAYLRWMPIDNLKLDKSFVLGIGADESNDKIVESIISLSHNLGMKSIAEGVETEQSLKLLKYNSCDFAQGYLFSKPISRDRLYDLLNRA